MPRTVPRRIDFALGQVVMTPGVLQALQAAGAIPLPYLARHAQGDWGAVDAHDAAANDRAARTGERVLSAYQLPNGTRIWIVTERDRSVTTSLLPEEY